MEPNYFRTLPEYDMHYLVTFVHDDASGMEGFVAIHRKNPSVPSFGATRLWTYASDEEALRDALRLSRLMSYKAALAGLPCGGAKGVILDTHVSEQERIRLIEAYARAIAPMRENFITGTDVGIKQEDLPLMKRYAPNVIGFNDNSTEFTALGVYHGLRCALRKLSGDENVEGRTFAIQGLGKIGSALLALLAPRARGVYVADIDPTAVARACESYRNVTPVPPDDIHRQKVDAFCPCAMGSAISLRNVAELACAAVVGGANNQLESEEVGDILHRMGILYAPDFVVNAGGLIAVYDEYEHPGAHDDARVRAKVMQIEARLSRLIEDSRTQNRPTNRLANEMAEGIFNGYGR